MNCTCGVGHTATGQHHPWCYQIFVNAHRLEVPTRTGAEARINLAMCVHGALGEILESHGYHLTDDELINVANALATAISTPETKR